MRLLHKALTFDDVLLVPRHSIVLPREVSLATRVSRNIRLNIPLVSAAMDTVTEARLAIALAQEGGIGIVHKNLTPQKQASEVSKVKRFESGVLKDPITIPPSMTVREVLSLTRSHRSARSSVPAPTPMAAPTRRRPSPSLQASGWWASSRTAICASKPTWTSPYRTS